MIRAKGAKPAFDLFADSTLSGFTYIPDVLAPQDEAGFVAEFEQLPFQPFQFHGYQGNRRTVCYGWRYDYGARRVEQAAAMPGFLAPLRELAGRVSGIPPAAFEHALITEYCPGAGIGWHKDKPMFHHVVAFSFLSSCRLRFRRETSYGWDRRNIMIERRSTYILDGQSRALWEHSIPAMDRKRYSVTFRDFRPEARR